MNGYYTLKTGNDNQYYWNLKAGNHEIILQSEGYTTKEGAENGINSCQVNSQLDERYENKVAKDGQYYFVLKAANHEPIGRSEMYTTEAARDNGIASCKTNGSSTVIKEQ